MKKRTRFQSLLALLLILCMLFSFCSVLTACGDDDEDEKACNHESTTVTGKKDATCAAEGYTGDTVCTQCTAVITKGSAIAKLAHTYDAGKVTKNPTCISTGLNTYTCTGCGTVKHDTIATVPHQDQYHDAQDGNHFHTCQFCPLNEKQTHTPTDAGLKVEATCTEGAYTLYTCADCEGQYKVYSETELALNHDFGDWVTTESTCLAAGSKTQSCQRPGCNESHSLPIPVATSCNMHFVGYEDDQAPDCIHDAVAIYQCEDCFSETTKVVTKTGIHSYVQVSAESGYVVKKCSVCDDMISSFDASTKVNAEVNASAIDKSQALEMNMKEAAIQFPSDVVGDITTGQKLEISAGVADTAKKNDAVNNVADEETKKALESAPVYDFTVKVDNQAYTDNFSTKVAITLSYNNGDNDSEGIVIYYLAEDGKIEPITDVVYNAETKEVTFFVEHFSFYAVAYKETQEMRCKRGNHDYKETDEKVTATCYQFGYTLYECSGCHRQTIDDIAERKAHEYGDIIAGVPTCDNGAWDTRVCQNPGCFSVLEVQFKGATGHEMDKTATCDSPSTCTKCGKILARPLGHDFGDWETVVKPTETSTGIRRRNCPVCGTTEEETLATLGTVEAIKYESYSDLINLVFKDLLDISSGKLEFSFGTSEDADSAVIKVTVEETNNGFRMNLVATVDGADVEFYYDNGVFVAITPAQGGMGLASDIDHIVPMAIDAYKEAMEEVYSQLDDYVKGYLKLARDYIAEYKTLYGEDINKILESAGLDYTVDDIDALVDSVETVYAYLSLKLGFTTSQEMKGEVILPTAKDFEAVLSLLMESTVSGGVTTYTLTAAPILEFANGLVAFMEEHADDTLAEFIYFAIGEELLEYNSTLTDFNATIDFIATKFPGTLTVKDAVDMYISFADANGLPTIDELYEIIDAAVEGYMLGTMPQSESEAPKFSSKALVEQYASVTLDELLKAATGKEEANIAQIYAVIKEMAANTIVGDYEFRGMTITALAATLKGILAGIEVKADLAISVDADGRILGVTLDHSFKMKPAFNPEAELVEIESVKLSVNRDSSVKVEIPASLKPVMNDVITSYDKNGNLIIEGLDINTDYKFSIEGYGSIDFDDVVSKSEALTKEYGREVYVLDKAYWHETDHLGSYYVVDGKYYDWNNIGWCANIEPTSTYKLADIAKMIKERLNSEELVQLGTLVDTEIPVYSLRLTDSSEAIGIVYKRGDVWTVSTQYGYISENGDMNGGKQEKAYNEKPGYDEDKDGASNRSYYVANETTLDEFTSTLKIGLTEEYGKGDMYNRDYYTVNYNGRTYKRLYATVSYGNGAGSVRLGGISVGSEFIFFDNYRTNDSCSIYSFDTEITELPTHDYSNTYNTRVAIFNAKGEIEFTSVKEITLWKKTPTYYVKVNDEVYVDLDSDYLFSSVDVSGKEERVLPDGNTLYIINRTSDNKYAYENNYETVYGYVKTVSNMYIQAAALLSEGDEVVEVLYRNASDMEELSLSGVYNIDDYLTRDKGTYKISAELISKLKALCNEEETMFSIQAMAEATIDGVPFVSRYVVESYIHMPEIDLDNMVGGGSSDRDFWYDGFGSDYGNQSNYDIVKNKDGSVSLIFPMEYNVTNVQFPSNAEFPADDLYVKNTELSEQTGLDIYSFNGSYTYTTSDNYVYRNGNYYNYSWDNNYDFVLVDNLNLATDWHISNTYYRFDMIGKEGLPNMLPVYQTEIRFGYNTYNNGSQYITLYTFVLDGVMNVAVKAEVTESELKFERYMPIDAYMKSLKFEFAGTTDNSYIRYNSGKKTTFYRDYINIYETDANGAKIGTSPKYTVNVEYTLQNGAKKYVYTYSYLSNIIKVDSTPVKIDNSTLEYERDEYTEKYYNGTVTKVSFSWQITQKYTANFVKLAGRMYRYDSHYWSDLNSYEYVKINEWEFNNQALDKVWFYLVVDEKNQTSTYYTEFIPSDYGFTPSGEVVDESKIPEEMYSEVLLGYTSDGLPLYEVAYRVTPDTTDWTQEPQADGTVFLHKDGTGYLKVTEKYGTYYVKAHKVKMADGSEQIYCFVRSGRLTGSEVSQYGDNLFDEYLYAEGNKITFTEQFRDIAANNNRNEFYVEVQYGNENHYWNSVRINYYQLESLFMLK